MEPTSDEFSRHQLKRQRQEEQQHTSVLPEEANVESSTVNKRQKQSSSFYYSDILSVLEEEEDENEPGQDLSSLITTLQDEISSSFSSSSVYNQQSIDPAAVANSGSEIPSSEISETERVMRRLLEASDDELGLVSIPNPNNNNNREEAEDEQQQQQTAGFDFVDEFNSGDGDLFIMPFGCSGGLWEIEDEAANYYTLLQSELFM